MAGELYPMPFKSVNGTTSPATVLPWYLLPAQLTLAAAATFAAKAANKSTISL